MTSFQGTLPGNPTQMSPTGAADPFGPTNSGTTRADHHVDPRDEADGAGPTPVSRLRRRPRSRLSCDLGPPPRWRARDCFSRSTTRRLEASYALPSTPVTASRRSFECTESSADGWSNWWEADPGDVPLTTSSIQTVQPGTSSSPSPGRGFEPPSSRDQQQRTEHDRPERQGQQYERRPAGYCE